MSREGAREQLSERERATLEVDQAQEAYSEAMDRLQGSDDYDELIFFTASPNQRPEDVEEFLRTNESRLSEEGKFFLNMTIHLRRANARWRELRRSSEAA
jgi:hypothetical protein